MKEIEVAFKFLKDDGSVRAPAYQTPGASGMDLHASIEELVILDPGCFDKDGAFYCIPCMPGEEQLEKLFMNKVLKMMMSLDKIDEDVVERLTNWTHSGFNIHIGNLIDSTDTKAYDALDFLALLSCHITDRWERRVIAYGYCLPPIFYRGVKQV
ncbi:MAG: hypothetical protein AB9903_27550 [Vulcanimicrobiota bacterium]